MLCKNSDGQAGKAIVKDSLQKPVYQSHINDSAEILVTQRLFRYKNLEEEYLDSNSIIEPVKFYGDWTITDIAKVGGTLESEREIRAQVGNRLRITKDEYSFNLFGYTNSTIHPEYRIKTFESDDNENLKGTTYWFGYRPERKKIYFLIAKGNYLELISYNEMAYYYDGRIYFFEKDK